MELRVFDKTVQPLGAIDELASLLWHTKYFDVGTFSLLAPITDNNSRLMVEGNLITKHDGKKEVKTADGGVWRRAAQITYVHITKVGHTDRCTHYRSNRNIPERRGNHRGDFWRQPADAGRPD